MHTMFAVLVNLQGFLAEANGGIGRKRRDAPIPHFDGEVNFFWKVPMTQKKNHDFLSACY